MQSMKKIWLVAGAAMSVTGSAFAADDANRAYAAEMLADASARTNALEASQAQAFVPKVGGYLQFRYTWNTRSEPIGPAGSEDSAIGFTTPRTVLSVQGNIASPQWGYYIQGNFNGAGTDGGTSNGGFRLEDAYGIYKMDNGWSILFGQAKTPMLRETLLGDTTLLAADRSVFESVFGAGRTQGVIANYAGDQFRFWGAFTDGANQANSDFTADSEADYALTGRVEYKWAGDWKQSNDFTSFRGSPYFGAIGGAVHWQDGGETFGAATGRTNDASLLQATIDATAEGDGWNFFAAFAYQSFENDTVGSEVDLDNYGFLVQGGAFVANDWELFGRFNYLRLDRDLAPAGTDVERDYFDLAIGTNYYFTPDSHAAKFTFDWTYVFSKTNANINYGDTLTGVLPDSDEGQWFFRAQMQLVF